MPEGKKSDEGKGKDPLSDEAWSWIMLLSGEINKEEMKLTTYWNAGLIITIALLGVAVAALVASLQSEVTLVDVISKILALALIISWLIIMIIYETHYRVPYQKRLKELINTREAIISGKLTDCNEIHGKWKDYIRRYYGKLLENTEMDEENKKLEGEKMIPRKRIWKKAKTSRKKFLQALQSDIQDMNESLRRIEDINEVSLYSSNWHIFGSSLIAIGFLVLLISEKTKIIGFLLILAGALMICGTYTAGKNVNLYKKPWKNIPLLLGIVLACLAIICVVIGSG